MYNKTGNKIVGTIKTNDRKVKNRINDKIFFASFKLISSLASGLFFFFKSLNLSTWKSMISLNKYTDDEAIEKIKKEMKVIKNSSVLNKLFVKIKGTKINKFLTQSSILSNWMINRKFFLIFIFIIRKGYQMKNEVSKNNFK